MQDYKQEAHNRLLETAKKKGYQVVNNLDGSFSLRANLSRRCVGCWKDAFGAIRYLDKQDNVRTNYRITRDNYFK